METLDHEKFEGVKELAEISTKISAGTAALAQLKASEETYLAEREVKLVERLKTALVDSAQLIKDIGSNHDSLVGYRIEVESFHERILSLIQGVEGSITLIEQASTELEKSITAHEADLAKYKNEVKREGALLEGERNELSQWRDNLGAAERLLDDRTKTLERSLNRIKK